MELEIRDFLSQLRTEEHTIAILYYEGYKTNEIAEIVGYAPAHVSVIISNIKKKWRDYVNTGTLSPEVG